MTARSSLLHELVETQAAATPDATAVVAGDARLTYRELDRRANELAWRVRDAGAGPERPVGILLPRSPDLVVGLLGVLKAGAPFLPLDRQHPLPRLERMLADAEASAVLAGDDSGLDLTPPRVQVEGLRGEDRSPERRASPESAAYVLFTSGSTGRPKGVVVEHRNAVAFVRWAHRFFAEAVLARTLASTPIGFDLSIFELFVPLASGGGVYLVESALDLAHAPADYAPTLVNTVPSVLALVLRHGRLPPSVRVVNLAGEPLTGELVDAIRRDSDARILNLYGPTETTTYSTAYEVGPGDEGRIAIGRPIDGTRVYVLDEQLEPTAQGELVIGGDGVSRGYVGDPALTADRFRPDPFGPPGARMYRTGDVGRLREDGVLEYVGRSDDQVKVGGIRIETGEIAAQLREHPAVADAVVLLRRDAAAGHRFVAFAISRAASPPAEDELDAHLRERLPRYMLPQAYVFVDEWPLSANGKLDRQALSSLADAAVRT